MQTELPPLGLLMPLQESDPQLTGLEGQLLVHRQLAMPLEVQMPCSLLGLDVPTHAESLQAGNFDGQEFWHGQPAFDPILQAQESSLPPYRPTHLELDYAISLRMAVVILGINTRCNLEHQMDTRVNRIGRRMRQPCNKLQQLVQRGCSGPCSLAHCIRSHRIPRRAVTMLPLGSLLVVMKDFQWEGPWYLR